MGKMKNILIEKVNSDEKLSPDLETAIILKFITEIIGEYLGNADEKKVIGLVLSINMNLMTNGMLCPKCFKDAINAIIDETFNIDEVNDGKDHEVRVKADGPMGHKKDKPQFH